MMVLIFYVPVTNKEEVKNALFDVGAGKIGNYDSCSFEVIGEGQFRPLENSTPTIGKKFEIEKVSEARVEISFEDSLLDVVIKKLKEVHPYETPAFHVVKSLA